PPWCCTEPRGAAADGGAGRTFPECLSNCHDRVPHLSADVRPVAGQIRLDSSMAEAVGPAPPDDAARGVKALRGGTGVRGPRMAHHLGDASQGALLRIEICHRLDELPLTVRQAGENPLDMSLRLRLCPLPAGQHLLRRDHVAATGIPRTDRKSTRLNSSH